MMRAMALTALLSALWLCGCAPSVEHTSETRSVPKPEAPLTGRSVQGRLIYCRVFGQGRGGALVIGGIHGDEPASATLAQALLTRLERSASLASAPAIVVPAANPDGLETHCRTNDLGVDINRNFPTSNWAAGPQRGSAPLSEPETRFLVGLIRRFRPSCVVQIHQPLGCIDWDGPARGLAAAMSRACGLRMRKLGARPGSLGSYAGVEQQIPTITLELPLSASRSSGDALWPRYGPALLVAIRSAQAKEGPPRLRIGGSIETNWYHVRSGR
jgi:protein MpaA